ncbi:beta-lactamase [Methanosarcina mazei]|uniref:Beta-lactamase n=1 Tax=Methanosarcina mazei TaxID=2209 RepID=A0A0F8I183_METMZ|nr:beta-lactamase [Methanosarcina mazei]
MRWIFGLIFILIVFAGINSGIKDFSPAEEIQQDTRQPVVHQTREADLTKTDTRAEVADGIESGQYRGLESNGLSDSTSDSTSDNSPADAGPANGKKQTDKNLIVHFIDVGQGDSILLEYDGRSMLVDAGERGQGSGVSAYLYEQDISGLDYVVATHPHSDHIGGMEEVINNFQVGLFIDSGFPHTTKTYENMLTTIDEKDIPFKIAKRGEKIEFGPAVDVELLNPGPEYSDDLNENSIVLKVSYGEVSFLFMGDAGIETEEEIINTGYDLDSDILKVGHHASRSGSGEKFISAVSPEISIIEVGERNDYGHPHPEVLERLQRTSRVYRTDLDGSIMVTTDGSTYTVITQKAGSGEEAAITGTAVSGDGSPSASMVTRRAGSEGVGSEASEPEGIGPGMNGISSSVESTVYVSDLSLRDEWIEITNRGSSPVSLKGWKIEDESSKHTYTFPSYTLDSQATVTLYTGKGTDTATEIFWGSGNPIWNNDGDTAYLYNDNGNLVDLLER